MPGRPSIVDGPRGGDQPAPGRRRHARVSPGRDDHRPTLRGRRACRLRPRRRSRRPRSTATSPPTVAAGWSARHEYLTHPVFHLHHPRPRCCATCAGCRPGPGARPHDDPARLVHHEAQRHHRDGAGDLARVRRHPPLRPAEQAAGYLQLIHELEASLPRSPATTPCRCSPTPARRASSPGCSPSAPTTAAGARRHRDVCLIPASAHGTNAASAAMAGMRVVVVACDDDGNVDLDDLRAKADRARRAPGRAHGHLPVDARRVRGTITEICDIVHTHGGQVYVDGANLNALVGVARPAVRRRRLPPEPAQDVLHPPRRWRPGRRARRRRRPPGAVPARTTRPRPRRARPPARAGLRRAVGLGGILPIPWTYTKLMGADGLRRATAVAILSANYMAAPARRALPGALHRRARPGGARVHHRPAPASPGRRASRVDDVAKRLIDYGFHAPTMSFPVAGTLMIEPTESEPSAEIDRFCDAMIAIKGEIDRVATASGRRRQPARPPPHTAEDLLVADWDRPTPREVAAYPHASCGDASTGRRSAASTAVTATATWCAPAPSPEPRSTKPDGFAWGGPRARRPGSPA